MSSFQRSVRRNRQAAASGRVRGHRSKRRQSRWADPPRQHLSAPKPTAISQPQAEMVDFDARLSEIIAAMPPLSIVPRRSLPVFDDRTPLERVGSRLAELSNGVDFSGPALNRKFISGKAKVIVTS